MAVERHRMAAEDDKLSVGVSELHQEIAKIFRELVHARLGTNRMGISCRAYSGSDKPAADQLSSVSLFTSEIASGPTIGSRSRSRGCSRVRFSTARDARVCARARRSASVMRVF